MNKATKKGLRRVVTLICAVVFLFSLYKLLDINQDYQEAEELYKDTANQYTTMVEPGKDPTMDFDLEEYLSRPPIQVDFTDLLKINDDIIGWIYMEDTVVNYPILQGENNFYYLDKTYYKKYLASGSIYLDSDNDRDFSDAHSIIYGHNMKNHTMFGDLSDLRDEKVLAEHPYVDIILIDGTWYRYEICSMYRAHVDDGTYRAPLNKASNFKPFMELIASKNMHGDSEILELPEVREDDKVLTLSTCTEDSANLERFVVHAVLIKENGKEVRETEE